MWKYQGQQRPSFAIPPGPGQESVWDYPRPPALVPDAREVGVWHAGVQIASTRRAWRVLETASPPTFYLPPDDIDLQQLMPVPGRSFCEWKGMARYWGLAGHPHLGAVAWSYDDPSADFAALRSMLAFYPAQLDCRVDRQPVRPQPGGFYGGWITDEIVGPYKGEAGTSGW